MNAALGSLGLTRLHWQALSIVQASGASTIPHLQREMRDFADTADLEGVLGSLEARGWLARAQTWRRNRKASDGKIVMSRVPE